jgi:hypothetical protein
LAYYGKISLKLLMLAPAASCDFAQSGMDGQSLASRSESSWLAKMPKTLIGV